MKAILTGGVALCALSLYAAEPQQPPNTTETVLAVPANAQVQDSPLVRAAKATGRLKKKPTNVITNEKLLKTGGHMATATTQAAVPSAPPRAVAQPKMNTADRQKQESAEKAKNAAALKAAAHRANADYHDDSVEPRYEDPAMQENVMRQGAQPATTTAQPPKPPML
jgi:hypothetical protein